MCGVMPLSRLRVRVQPGAKRNELLGIFEGVLRVKLAAQPIEGKANRALIAMLGDMLHVPKSRIRVILGQVARDKVVEVDGLDQDEVIARLRGHLTG